MGKGWLYGLGLLVGCGPLVGAPQPSNAGGGTLTVSWRAPTRNTDGSPLTDLTGYTIYYGTQHRIYTTEILIDDPSATRAVVHGLQPGIYYFFAVTANSASGRHSMFSSEARGKARRE
jgi:hypothetical protein